LNVKEHLVINVTRIKLPLCTTTQDHKILRKSGLHTLAGVTPISTLDLEHRPTTKYQIRSHCFEDVSHYTELEIHASDGYSKNYESKTSQ
jgi:hypothetical protein